MVYCGRKTFSILESGTDYVICEEKHQHKQRKQLVQQHFGEAISTGKNSFLLFKIKLVSEMEDSPTDIVRCQVIIYHKYQLENNKLNNFYSSVSHDAIVKSL
jgi:hypothetical protein